jgi:hypothetical protein
MTAEPAITAISRAVAEGCLTVADMARAPTAAEVARRCPAPAEPGEKPPSATLAELREEDGER